MLWLVVSFVCAFRPASGALTLKSTSGGIIHHYIPHEIHGVAWGHQVFPPRRDDDRRQFQVPVDALNRITPEAVPAEDKPMKQPLEQKSVEPAENKVQPLQVNKTSATVVTRLSNAGKRLKKLQSSDSPDAFVQVLGLFNSGTNLLAATIDHNFPRIDTGANHAGSTIFWKHLPPSSLTTKRDFGTLDRKSTFSESLVVAVVRDPFAWLKSIKRNPYDLTACVRTTAKDAKWLSAPCALDAESAWSQSLKQLRPFHVEFGSVVDVWNNYTRGYLDLLPKVGFSHSLVLRFEDIVRDPGLAMLRVQEDLPLKLQQEYGPFDVASVQVVDTPLKETHHGRSEVLSDLNAAQHLVGWTPEEVHTICGLLDSSLLKRLDYDDCDHISRSSF